MVKKSIIKGFTLIEILVSVSIVGILSLVISQAFFTTLRSNAKTELMKEIKQNGDYAMQTMVRLIQNAGGVSQPCGGTSLNFSNIDGEEITISPYLDTASGHNNSCRIKYIKSNDPLTNYDLTSYNVTLTKIPSDCPSGIIFTCEGSKVNVAFTLTGTGSSTDTIDTAKQKFSSTAVVRNMQ